MNNGPDNTFGDVKQADGRKDLNRFSKYHVLRGVVIKNGRTLLNKNKEHKNTETEYKR